MSPNSDETYNPVFVDTSLGTHLAMVVFKSDTVSDFKKKIALEHMHYFPKFEDIHIHSVKVKVKCSAHFYHLPDSMPVWSAFPCAEERNNWVLSVDASHAPAKSETETKKRRSRTKLKIQKKKSKRQSFNKLQLSSTGNTAVEPGHTEKKNSGKQEAASSQVLSRQTEEKLEEKHEFGGQCC